MGFKSVDEYLNLAPIETRAMARQVREIIRENAPKAEEVTSYQMPYYRYKGRLLYFAAYETYIGLYVMAEAREALRQELEPYRTSKATYKFPANQPLPTDLIKKVVRTQVAANEQR